VFFVDTSSGLVPDIYLSSESPSIRRRTPSTFLPMSMKMSSRSNSFLDRSSLDTFSPSVRRTMANYTSNPVNYYRRPVSSSLIDDSMNKSNGFLNSSFVNESPERIRLHSSLSKPLEFTYEPYLRSRMDGLRTDYYLPSYSHRYYLP
jgi:hypothetical protein